MVEKAHSTMAGSARRNGPGKPKSVSARLREFATKPSPSMLREEEIRGTFREFSEHLLRKNVLRECENGFIVWDPDSLRGFCKENVLPLTTRLAEEGIYLSGSFKSNGFLSSDIFHRAVLGGSGASPYSVISGETCPVFSGPILPYSG